MIGRKRIKGDQIQTGHLTAVKGSAQEPKPEIAVMSEQKQ
jgi:hypothetical protein